MKGYGQFCPVAKAAEILAERWTPLVIRELLCGSTRFNDIRRGVPRMSRSLLSRRLQTLEDAGVVVRRPGDDHPHDEYHLTAAGEELRPLIVGLGDWGHRWVQQEVSSDDLDPELLLWDMRRRIRQEALPDERVTVHFELSDAEESLRTWWLVLEPTEVDLCLTDPGLDVDLWVRSTVRTLTRIWLGHLGFREALGRDDFEIAGPRRLVRAFPEWLELSLFAHAETPEST